MNNRFTGVKTLGDLYLVFSNEDVSDYDNLTEAELERVADVFEANLPNKVDMPDRPLTEAGYTLIWNVTVDTIEEFINNNIITGDEAPEKEKEVKDMSSSNFNNEFSKDDLLNNMDAAKNNAANGIDNAATPESAAGKADDSVDFVKGAFGKFLGVLDVQFGCTALKNTILSIIRDSRVELEGGEKGRLAFFAVAKNCRKAVDDYCNNVLIPLGKEQKAMNLKDMFNDNDGHCLFTRVFDTLWWIGNKTYEKLRKFKLKVKEGGILAHILKGVKVLAKALMKGVKIILNVVKYTASFVAASAAVIIDLIVSSIKAIVAKVKAWQEAKNAGDETAAANVAEDIKEVVETAETVIAEFSDEIIAE
jgi:hypothetical protein